MCSFDKEASHEFEKPSNETRVRTRDFHLRRRDGAKSDNQPESEFRT
jgi:hypothetical protein